MATADYQAVLPVDRDKLFTAITKYEDYPSFVDGCKSVKVERGELHSAKVTYEVSMIKDISSYLTDPLR